MKKWLIKIKTIMLKVRDFLDEKAIGSIHLRPLSRMHKFAHFCLMVAKGFSRNRCFMQASALAYTSLLALIPMLFVAISISTSLLKQEGGQRINHFVDKLLLSMTPATAAPANATPTNSYATNVDALVTATDAKSNEEISDTNSIPGTTPAEKKNASNPQNTTSREQIVHVINGVIGNIQQRSLGVTGMVVLVLMAVSLLSRVESTFNDIWGVKQGRNWLARGIQYWAILSLGPLLVAAALALSNGSGMQPTREFLHSTPMIGMIFFKSAPVVLLCLTFSVFYFIIPNTKVHWSAAFIGGTFSGMLWHLNNYYSVLYVSRWVTYSHIYGSLAVVPIFMIGIYLSWLILLFGAQVAHAFQNRGIYLQEKQAENINQRGREFIGLRLMEFVGRRFQHNLLPANAAQLAADLMIPECLAEEIMEILSGAGLIVEGAGENPSYVPARPLENITCHDILLALRTGEGQELSTRDEPARAEVFGEFEKILEAERKASAAVTVLMMVDRSERKALPAGRAAKAELQQKTD